MSGRHQPLNGADSEAPVPYLVHLVDPDDPDARPFTKTIRVWGPKDKKRHLDDLSTRYLVLSVREAA
jgi:hypothetical protein